MFSLKALSLENIIKAVNAEGKELTPELLTSLVDPQTSTYDLNSLLCAYINGLTKLKDGKDLQEICTLKMRLHDLNRDYDLLNRKYNRSLTEQLEGKKKELNLKARNCDLEKQVEKLSNRLEALENTLTAMKGVSEP